MTIEEANNDLVFALKNGLSVGPCHIPWVMQQATRDAIKAYEEGSRDPAVLFCLCGMFSSMNDNALRYRSVQAFQVLAQTFAL